MLEIRNLTVMYGSHRALYDFSLQVQAGEILAVIGPNGAGKSTLIKAVSGVLRPVSGEITLAGQPITHINGSRRAQQTAVVPQGGHLPKAFTVEQTVMLGRTPYLGWLGRPQEQDRHSTEAALRETDLLEMRERIVGELSGGEQQRVLLARALAQDTQVLLLDEPTAHLDLRHQAGILKLVRRLAAEKKLAVLMVVHDLNHAALFADRVALLVKGEKIAEGPSAQVLTKANLSGMYGVDVVVTVHPGTGKPVVLLD